MSFQRVLKLPQDRIGVLVGKKGAIKSEIERRCGITLSVNSKSGEVTIDSGKDIGRSETFKAVEIVMAIGRGFSPQRAFKLLDEDVVFSVVDLRDYSGKSNSSLKRIKGRIIGLGGKGRKTIEELTGTSISVFGHTASVIGKVDEVRSALEAIDMLASGSVHKSVYNMLQREKRKAKIDRMKLWEEF
ncbi:MAG: KH domain-containing protein [Candidatus Methylarchaceae archaeon HK02M2]|nr:KH domain-containing protein [Candidatus Methylarchaceae archaeon HK02M2]